MQIPVNEPLLNGNEKRYLSECIDSGWISSEGPFVARFEKEFAATVSRRHGIATANGSGALDVAIAALGLGPGDEVIMPSFTIISCAQAIVRQGATPVLVDCDQANWNMDADQIEAKITPRTRAIMAVHIYGLTSAMEKILDLANRYHLKIIEDAAQAIGQHHNGQPCGSFGDLSIVSFYPNKHITTGEGGMVLTDNQELADRCRALINLCFQPQKRFVHKELGWNYRMTNLQAAVGCAQLEQLSRHVARKREIGHLYNTLLCDCPVQRPLPSAHGTENIYWVYGLVLPDDAPLSATKAMSRLSTKGIGTRPFFWPMHQQPVFLQMGLFQDHHLPVSERLARQGLYLPSGLAITDTQIQYVADEVKRILQ
ncbi:MAG: DegT/DnrJ/EryC1/StrS family aminotransferase [Proteobacteria bacterium]|nr:DegT/DnrJ/EryC1/StrS family aminotransferase [Desulfobulbaceae bacterium]MBU4151637.1 DegT/DnrJ/EryC1/StrS family aminotransferase [Pseudomonadota bacterium]MDP2105518.1 DegT/DnrJ/EryC1/StrS family aminotransferase [Desulfobulbaceae bacterium]